MIFIFYEISGLEIITKLLLWKRALQTFYDLLFLPLLLDKPLPPHYFPFPLGCQETQCLLPFLTLGWGASMTSL